MHAGIDAAADADAAPPDFWMSPEAVAAVDGGSQAAGAQAAVEVPARATAGTGAITIHIPPGFPFAPMLPDKEDELFMGSATVVADGDPLSHLALPVLGCQIAGMPSPPRLKKKRIPKPTLLPTTFNLAIPGNVVVGGPQGDFVLPGRIPIEWQRSYRSGSRRSGACGVGWESPADARLEIDAQDGSVLFLHPGEGPALFDQLPQAQGDAGAVLELMDGALLSDHGDEWRVRTKSDRIYHFRKALAFANAEGLRRCRWSASATCAATGWRTSAWKGGWWRSANPAGATC